MPRSDLTVNYQSRTLAVGTAARAIGSAILCVALPAFLLSIIFPGGRGLIFLAIHALNIGSKAFQGGDVVVILILLLFLVFAFWRAVAQMFATSVIRITPDAIQLPQAFLFSTKGRRQRLWSDISNVSLSGTEDIRTGQLTIFFKSGGYAAINLKKIEKAQLEQLLLAIEMRSSNASQDPNLELLLDILHDEKETKGELSYTHLWETDMNRRFSQVAFVPLEPQQTLQNGKLKVLSQLAFGGLSAIYLAENLQKERFILKEAAIPKGANPALIEKAEEMLRTEASVLMQLSHSQIVRMKDFFIEENKAYLVLDFVPGENLRQLVCRAGPVDSATACDWACQVCEILEYLHNQVPPIVHRDISPDNLIVNSAGKIMLIDFGTAHEYLVTATGTSVGKQCYVSPEQFKGKARRQSDIYSLGATVYFILTGQDPEPLFEAHPNVLNTTISPELDELVAECMRLEWKERIQSAESAKEHFNRLSQERRIMNSDGQEISDKLQITE